MRVASRVKTPTVFQMESVECGAACLSMILGFYGKYVSLEQLRIDCGITRDGCKALNIIKAGKKYGLKGEGYQVDFEALQQLDMPIILFWRFSHYIVLEGIQEDKFYINDPAIGRAVISGEEFTRSFSGVVITLTPTDKFRTGGEPPQILRQVLKRLKAYWLPLSFIFLAGFLFTLVGLLIPIFSKVFVDYFLIERMQTIIKPLLIGMVLTAVLRFILSLMQNYHLTKLTTKLSTVFSTSFLWHLLQLPIHFFSLRYTGDIARRVLSNQDIAKFIVNVFIESTLNAIFVVLFALLLLYYDPLIMMVTTGIASVNIILFYFLAKIRRDKSLLLSNDLGIYYGRAYGSFKIIEAIKSSSQEANLFSQIVGAQIKAANTFQELSKKTVVYSALPILLNSINVAAVLLIGANKVMEGFLSVGTLVAIQSLVISYINPLNKLVDNISSIQEMSGTIARIDDVLMYKKDEKINFADFYDVNKLMVQENVKLAGNIELNNISFGYNKLEKMLIKNISLSIQPGEHVAIVGASGSGKSTFAKLLANLYEPWAGDIKVDGLHLKDINRMVIVNSLSLVEQDNVMFNCSIKDNIIMWDNTIRFDDLIQAAKDAEIHDEISLREYGYDSMVYQQGSNFSGGQRQRLDIARSLVMNPTILILDEATSELDPLTENKIFNNIRRRGCTTIIIAHRLSTIRNVDKIVVLDQGKIVQIGTHEELISIPGKYKDLMYSE